MTTATTTRTRLQRLWPWLLGFYAAGVVLDFLYHLYLAQQTGDHQITLSDIAVGITASLFWPVDFLFRIALSSL
jgi:hypothetical protein